MCKGPHGPFLMPQPLHDMSILLTQGIKLRAREQPMFLTIFGRTEGTLLTVNPLRVMDQGVHSDMFPTGKGEKNPLLAGRPFFDTSGECNWVHVLDVKVRPMNLRSNISRP